MRGIRKFRSLFIMSVIAVFAFVLPDPGQAAIQWENGMDATAVIGQPDFTTVTFSTTADSLTRGTGVAYDPTTGKVFVSDRNRVLRFSSQAALTTGQPAEAVLGQLDFTSDLINQGSANPGPNTMDAPEMIYVDSTGTLWVADAGNNRVLRFDDAANKATGAAADGVLGQPDFVSSTPNNGGIGATVMNYPISVAVDSTGTLWVSEVDNNRVLRFDDAANKANGAAADGVLGQPDFVSNTLNNGGLSASSMEFPTALEVESDGTLWVADFSNSRVLRFDNAASKANGAAADGVLGQVDFTMNSPNRGGSVAANTLFNPLGLAVDDSGTLYVADRNNHRVLRFVNAANKANGAAADGVLGQPNFTVNSMDRGGATGANTLAGPNDVEVVGATSTLWIREYDNARVLVFDAPNAAPNIINPGDQMDSEGDVVNLAVGAWDSESTQLTYAAVNLPDGLSIDPATGIVSGTIGYGASSGSPYVVEITVTDDDPLPEASTVTFTWTVSNTNRAPTLDPIADQTNMTGDTVSLTVTANDPDGDALTYQAVNLPDGLSIDPDAGVISGTIDIEAPSDSPYAVEITVTDDDPLPEASTVTFTWTVSNTNRPPTLDPIADQTNATGDTVRLTVTANDPDGDTLTYQAVDLPDGLSIAPDTGEITGVPTIVGTSEVTVSVSDGLATAEVTFIWAIVDENLLANSGFETAVDGSDWTMIASGNNSDGRFAPPAPYLNEGEHILLIAANGDLEAVVQTVSGIDGAAGDIITLSFDYGYVNLSDEGIIGARVILRSAGGEQQVVNCVITERTAPTILWTEYTCDATAAIAYNSITVLVGVLDVGSGLFGIDDVQLSN